MTDSDDLLSLNPPDLDAWISSLPRDQHLVSFAHQVDALVFEHGLSPRLAATVLVIAHAADLGRQDELTKGTFR
jgi:hypothetical protein